MHKTLNTFQFPTEQLRVLAFHKPDPPPPPPTPEVFSHCIYRKFGKSAVKTFLSSNCSGLRMNWVGLKKSIKMGRGGGRIECRHFERPYRQYHRCTLTVFLKAETIDRGQLKCDGARAQTRFRLSAKRTSPFKPAWDVSSVDYWQPRCPHQR